MRRLTIYVQVKGGIVLIRQNITNYLWNYTQTEPVLNESVWIMNATKILEEFESKIVQSIKYRGWDGNEDINKLRWTKIGALFYSIIVITTIGKKHTDDSDHIILINSQTNGFKLFSLVYGQIVLF